MILSESSRIHPLDDSAESWLVINLWCRDYIRHNKYPCDVLKRYAIGIYQIHQGLEWGDLLNKAESFMAAFLHFQMVAEHLNLALFDITDDSILKLETKPLQAERLLWLISKAQQQLFYAHKVQQTSLTGAKYQRASRYKPALLTSLLTELQTRLISMVPKDYRLQGLYHASKIMSGQL